MNILMTGATGFIGKPLTTRLISEGHQITAWVRDAVKAKASLPEKVTCIEKLDQLSDENFDGVINLAGEPIADKRWTAARKLSLRASRIDLTHQLVSHLKKQVTLPKVILSGSAIGYYGSQVNDEELDESGYFEPGFTHRLCADWEAAALKLESDITRVCLLRTGIVLEQGGGALNKMLMPFKLGLGGPISNGKQVMSWIHLQDWINAAVFLLNNETCSGAYNFVSPEPVTNRIFTQQLADALKRPVFFKVPCFVLQLAMGEAAELLCKGQRVVPKKLIDAGFEFKFTNIRNALGNIVRH